MNTLPSIVLASASPRRRELLARLGVTFRVMASDVNEDPLTNETPLQTQQRITRNKARVVQTQLLAADPIHQDTVVIAADTTVLLDGEMLNKPTDAAEAWSMLRKLRGRAHEVQTCLVICEGAREEMHIAACQVQMRNYSDDEIAAYITTGDPFDKAGAYAVQHAQFHPVDEIVGCPLNVIGLPLCQLRRFQQCEFECKIEGVACRDNECAARGSLRHAQ